MKKILFVPLLLCFGLLNTRNLDAQYYTNQNKVWIFGYNAGVNFSSGIPVPILSGIYTNEGSASLSDAEGNLLFYTDGRTIWDRANNMFGSICYNNVSSSSQAGLIMPVLGNPNQFYVFSTEEIEDYEWYHDSLAPRHYYGIVDMTLNSGFGGVVPGSTKLLSTKSTEKQIAISGNSNDIWLLAHRRDTSLFLAYHITTSGIDTVPVVSNAGNMVGLGSYDAGVMKCSPNRRKIVVQNYDTYADTGFTFFVPSHVGTELYDFDPTSGIVSNSQRIDIGDFEYGAEFSPDNTKLYTMSSDSIGMTISQYDITLGSSVAITASKVIIAIGAWNTDLKIGPDGKIYLNGVDSFNHRYLDCISSPNSPGLACNYIHSAVHLLDGSQGHYGLPNLFVTADTMNTAGIDEEIINSNISLYPNPAHNSLVISSTDKITNVIVSNLIGQNVYTSENNGRKIQVDVANLPAGIYIVRINSSEVRKFVKE